jgi:hypothetical protein
MNKTSNAFLLTAATALVTLGVSTIQGNLLTGAIELVLGLAVFLAYEFLP